MRKLIRNILQRFGYDIIKTDNRYKSKGNGERIAQVGKYKICMPGNNIQLDNYKLYPDLNAQLGRLAFIVAGKYPEMTIVDVGANVGDTIAVIKSFVEIPVIGIEGDAVSFQYLEKNTKQFNDVNIVKTFLGEKKSEVKVTLDKAGWNTTIIPDDKGETISIKTLDEVLAVDDLAKQEIKLLKVDVEGYDTIVLRGAINTIEKYNPVLFFEYNRENMQTIKEDGLPTLLSYAAAGYNKAVFFDHKGRLLIATSVLNQGELTHLHNYVIGKNNLLGYFDICLFHKNDDDIAEIFIKKEQGFL